MTQVFTGEGDLVPVTVIQAGPCTVVQAKTPARDHYAAVQLGFASQKESRIGKAMQGHVQKAGKGPFRVLREFKVGADSQLEVGQDVRVGDVFAAGDVVDVSGVSKGRGTAGVMKRHKFSGFPGSHGTHEYFRHGGSIGNRSFPGRVFKGKRMSGRLGNERVTIENLRGRRGPRRAGPDLRTRRRSRRDGRHRDHLQAGRRDGCRSGQWLSSDPLTATVFSQTRAEVGTVELPATIFTEPLRRALLADVVRMQTAGRRSGTHATKEKGEVRGGGRKPWKQKGTGRARAGSIRSPLWPGGGTIFGPHPRDYSYSMPKQARQAALRSVLAQKLREERLTIVDRIELRRSEDQALRRAAARRSASTTRRSS